MAGTVLGFATRFTNVLNPNNINSFEKKLNDEFIRAYNKSAKKVANEDKDEVRGLVPSKFKVKKAGFKNAFGYKFFERKTNETGSFLFYNKTDYYDIHNFGGVISKKRLVPASNNIKRVTRKAFDKQIKDLFAKGNYFWKKKGNNTLLFAILEKNGKVQQTYKKRRGNAVGHSGKYKNDGKTIVLIATLIRTRTYRVRINFEQRLLAKSIRKIRDGFNKEFKINNVIK